MASYKVAQDVEADDKLIGPLSFKQFIYLLIAIGAGFLSWGLSTIFLPLFILPVPIILLFGTLALPLKKDQPMETYLAAIISYHIKPKVRIWQRDGIMSIIEINAPKTEDKINGNYLGEYETDRRLAFLSNIADTKGWAIRNATEDYATGQFSEEIYDATNQAPDMLDSSGQLSQHLDTMISDSQEQYRQSLLAKMRQQPTSTPQPVTMQQPVAPQQSTVAPQQSTVAPQQYATQQQIQQPNVQQGASVATQQQTSAPSFNPYPSSMQQSVIEPVATQQAAQPMQWQNQTAPVQQPQPLAPAEQYTTPLGYSSGTYQTPAQPQEASSPGGDIYQSIVEKAQSTTELAKNTSTEQVSPDIIELANEKNLSIQTIQDQADKRSKKKKEKEVFISLH